MEAKYSYNDFKNGFCIGGEYNYVIAPKNVIPKKELPSFVGLIEIDFDNFRYNSKNIRGYNSVKRARKIKIPKYVKEEELNIMKWRMLYKLTEDKYTDHWLDGIKLKEKYKDKFNQGVMWKQ